MAPRRATVALAVGVALAIAASVVVLRARRERAAWWGRAERLCACGETTRRSLGRLSVEAVGGLDEVAGAQRALLHSDCDDLRVAVARRSWTDEALHRPLRVMATDPHRRRAAAVSGALAAMCGGANEDFWSRLAVDLAAHADDPPADDPYRVRAVARGHLAIQRAMCAGRARLTAAPRSYELTVSEGDRQSADCPHELARGAR